MKSYLKIKVVSLGDEARRIRKDEQKWLKKARRADARLAAATNDPSISERAGGDVAAASERNKAFAYKNFFGLREHRIDVVKAECRAATIAYAFARKKSYASVERTTYTKPDWDKVEKIARDFDPESTWEWERVQAGEGKTKYVKFSKWAPGREKAWERWLKEAKDHFWHEGDPKRAKERKALSAA